MLTGAVVAALWGLTAASGLLIGATIAYLWKLPHPVVASTMGFGAGVLVAVLSFELLRDAAKHGSLGTITSAFVIGATLFCAANWLLARHGAKHRNRCGDCERQATETDQPGSGLSIAIGAVVDGVPESVVIGLTLVGGGTIGTVVLAGFFIANVPQGLSGAFGMKKAGRSAAYVFTLWTAVAVLSGAAAAFGFLVVSRMPPTSEAVANALAAGGVLAMLAETMIPEAFAQAPVFIGFVTAIGFTAAYALSMAG